jgi:hypothetical protein
MSNEHLAAEAVASRVLELAAGLAERGRMVSFASTMRELGLDDLDAVELVMAVEDDFEVDIDVSEYEDAPEKFLAMPLQVLIDMALKAVGQSPAAALRSSGPAEDVKPNPQAFQHCVTPDMITAAIVAADYHVLPGTQITVCTLTLRNGTKVLGYNYGAIDTARQDWKQGRQAAYDMAREKIWELEGYALRERLAAPVVSASFLLNATPEQEADLLEKLRKAPSSGIFLTALDPDAGKAVAALLQAAEAMRAFTDPEGNMPADTGEFNDLKEALAVAEGVLAGNAQAMDGGPNPHYDREALAKKMSDRFLGWKLPQNFAPDGGVSFVPPFHWPTGTNLLHAGQALDMFRYCLGLADAEEVQP